jgi:hypothetical protein
VSDRRRSVLMIGREVEAMACFIFDFIGNGGYANLRSKFLDVVGLKESLEFFWRYLGGKGSLCGGYERGAGVESVMRGRKQAIGQ